jgi:hypothetical protein
MIPPPIQQAMWAGTSSPLNARHRRDGALTASSDSGAPERGAPSGFLSPGRCTSRRAFEAGIFVQGQGRGCPNPDCFSNHGDGQVRGSGVQLVDEWRDGDQDDE